MNDKFKPALIGGVIVGLLSAVPIINFVNACCCLWAILGGLVASFLYIKKSPTAVSAGDGAILGALAGTVGAAIYVVVGIPINIALRGTMNEFFISSMERVDPTQAELIRQMMQADVSVLSVIIQGIILAFLLIVFSTIGGLLAIPIFERRKGAPNMPPPPQDFGGGPAGTYGTGL